MNLTLAMPLARVLKPNASICHTGVEVATQKGSRGTSEHSSYFGLFREARSIQLLCQVCQVIFDRRCPFDHRLNGFKTRSPPVVCASRQGVNPQTRCQSSPDVCYRLISGSAFDGGLLSQCAKSRMRRDHDGKHGGRRNYALTDSSHYCFGIAQSGHRWITAVSPARLRWRKFS